MEDIEKKEIKIEECKKNKAHQKINIEIVKKLLILKKSILIKRIL